MDYGEFKEKIAKLLREKLDDDTRISCEKIPKNNGIVMDGMVFACKGADTQPILYLEEYYRLWMRGVPLEQLAEKMIWTYTRHRERIQVGRELLENYEQAEKNIFYQLIHYEKNRERLKELPHRRVLDLAMVFYLRVIQENERGTVLIRNDILERWGISRDTLEENARRRSWEKLPAQLITLEEILGLGGEELTAADGRNVPMYILTNQARSLGAGVILYPGLLKEISRILGEEFYILPSSIHECILVPESMHYDQKELARMVKDINREHVSLQEVLSDSVYRYRREEDRIIC